MDVSNFSVPLDSGHAELSLGNFHRLPQEMIVLFLSHTKALELLRLSRLNKTFYNLIQRSDLWKRLTILNYPHAILSMSVIQWKTLYQLQHLYQTNFRLFRQRTCSRIASTLPYSDNRSRSKAISSACRDYYLSFNLKGHLQAVFQDKNNLRVFNIQGQVIEIEPEEWNARIFIHHQFIQYAFLDGNQPFNLELKLEENATLNIDQTLALQNLNQKIQAWLTKTAKKLDLDQQIQTIIKKHYPSRKSAFNCIRNAKLTEAHQAYFLLFRGALDNPCLQKCASPNLNQRKSIRYQRTPSHAN